MKYISFVALSIFSFVLFTDSSFALVNNVNDKKSVPVSSVIQKGRNLQKLNKSIYLHQKQYYNKKSSTLDEKNIYYRMTRAAQARKAGHVGSHATEMNREGALTDWEKTREFQQSSSFRPNSKAVFRRCIINYYFEGGNCSSDELKEGLIYSSQHTISRIPNTFWTRDIEAIRTLRDVQRKMTKPEQIGAGQQRQRAIHNGDSSRSYTSPFTKTYFNPED